MVDVGKMTPAELRDEVVRLRHATKEAALLRGALASLFEEGRRDHEAGKTWLIGSPMGRAEVALDRSLQRRGVYTYKLTVGPTSEFSQESWASPTEAAAEAIKHIVRNIEQYKYPATVEIFEADQVLFALRFELERPDLPRGSPE